MKKKKIIFSLIFSLTIIVCLFLGEKKVFTRSLSKIEKTRCSPNYNFEADVPSIHIYLREKQKKNLLGQLKFYNKNGTLSNNYKEGNRYQKAKIILDNDTHKISIKIKGRYSDNYKNHKAFSLKIKQKNKIGKKISFSLYPIICKSLIKEWVINQILKIEKLPYYDVKLVKVKILDSEYLAYKVPSKPNFKGVVLNNLMRLNNDMNFKILSEKGWFDSDNHEFLNFNFSNSIDSTTKEFFENKFSKRSFEFNDLAKTIALLKMFQNHMPGHGIMIHNAVFWLNEEDSLLRVVCSDHNFLGKTTPDGYDNLIADQFYSKFLQNIEFCRALNFYLRHYSNPNISENWYNTIGPKLLEKVKIIQKQYPCYDYTFDDVLNNSFELKKMVEVSLDTIYNSKKSFLVNFGYTPVELLDNDTPVLLYPKNLSSWPSYIELEE